MVTPTWRLHSLEHATNKKVSVWQRRFESPATNEVSHQPVDYCFDSLESISSCFECFDSLITISFSPQLKTCHQDTKTHENKSADNLYIVLVFVLNPSRLSVHPLRTCPSQADKPTPTWYKVPKHYMVTPTWRTTEVQNTQPTAG